MVCERDLRKSCPDKTDIPGEDFVDIIIPNTYQPLGGLHIKWGKN